MCTKQQQLLLDSIELLNTIQFPLYCSSDCKEEKRSRQLCQKRLLRTLIMVCKQPSEIITSSNYFAILMSFFCREMLAQNMRGDHFFFVFHLRNFFIVFEVFFLGGNNITTYYFVVFYCTFFLENLLELTKRPYKAY